MNQDKPYSKFVVDNSPTMGEGRYEDGQYKLSQEKYNVGSGRIAYEDETRDTADDMLDESREQAGRAGQKYDNEDESQGGKF